MGNRYTSSTLTKREIDTIKSIQGKLAVIYNRNKAKSVPDHEMLGHLAVAFSNLNDALEEVERTRVIS